MALEESGPDTTKWNLERFEKAIKSGVKPSKMSKRQESFMKNLEAAPPPPPPEEPAQKLSDPAEIPPFPGIPEGERLEFVVKDVTYTVYGSEDGTETYVESPEGEIVAVWKATEVDEELTDHLSKWWNAQHINVIYGSVCYDPHDLAEEDPGDATPPEDMVDEAEELPDVPKYDGMARTSGMINGAGVIYDHRVDDCANLNASMSNGVCVLMGHKPCVFLGGNQTECDIYKNWAEGKYVSGKGKGRYGLE